MSDKSMKEADAIATNLAAEIYGALGYHIIEDADACKVQIKDQIISGLKLEEIFNANYLHGVQKMEDDKQYNLLVSERDALKFKLKVQENWPHCEACNFPLQDQGTPNGMVCLLCDVRDMLRETRGELSRLRLEKEHKSGGMM